MGLTRPRNYQVLDSDYKNSVRAATTGAVTLTGGAPSIVDSTVVLNKGDRILVKNQGSPAQNGIYSVQTVGTGSNGTWVRAVDYNTSSQISSGTVIYVEEGSANGDTIFTLSTNNPIVLDTTPLVFAALTSGTGPATATDTGAMTFLLMGA